MRLLLLKKECSPALPLSENAELIAQGQWALTSGARVCWMSNNPIPSLYHNRTTQSWSQWTVVCQTLWIYLLQRRLFAYFVCVRNYMLLCHWMTQWLSDWPIINSQSKPGRASIWECLLLNMVLLRLTSYCVVECDESALLIVNHSVTDLPSWCVVDPYFKLFVGHKQFGTNSPQGTSWFTVRPRVKCQCFGIVSRNMEAFSFELNGYF